MTRWLCCLLLCAGALQADSINLFNDSPYTLKAMIYDSNGVLMGEFILNPRDASEWNNNNQAFGAMDSTAPQPPYSVQWTCMAGGGSYGSCSDVAAGATVTAQGCGGPQQCQPAQSSP
jgi:hypothetical protein